MLLLASWLAMTIVGFAAIGIIEYKYVKKGDPIRLLHPFDYAGQVCGYDSEVKSKPLGYYMSTGALVCVSECPKTTDMDTFYCYDDAQSVLDPLYTSNYALYTTTAWNYVTDGKCMYAVESTNVAYRCVMSEAQEVVELAVQSATNNNVPLSYSSAENAGGWFTRYIGDILTLKDYVFGFGLGVSVGISFLYLYFLRLPGLLFAVIWSCVLSIEGVFVVATILLHDLYRSWEDGGVKPSNEILVIKVFFWICLGISALYFCLVLVLRKRIMLAIGIIKEAGRALATMPSVIFLPVLQSAGMVAFIVPWFIYMLYLGSSGTIVNVTVYNDYSQTSVTYRKFEYDEYTKYAMIYMLFCWFWTSQFIIALGQLSLAMCIVCWYFTKDKSTIGNGTVFWVI
jgi:hypothetical protein